ncbi:MAG: hypothetical protein ACKO8H_15790 [Microcystis panniformis]
MEKITVYLVIVPLILGKVASRLHRSWLAKTNPYGKKTCFINYNLQYRRAKTPGATCFFTLVTEHL